MKNDMKRSLERNKLEKFDRIPGLWPSEVRTRKRQGEGEMFRYSSLDINVVVVKHSGGEA
jgi:hypothetical protein